MQYPVNALAVLGTDLYAGGYFYYVTNSGPAPVTVARIAKWNGNTWSAVGNGVNNYVYALAASGPDLYAGGDFTYASGLRAYRTARWNGSAWSALGLGVNGSVTALAVSGTDLYAGGAFTYATNAGPSALRVNYVGKWNGSAWSALASGLNGTVSALAASGTDLYAGGSFTYATNAGAGAVPVNYVAKWNGSAWSALGSGMSDPVYALAVSGSDLYAGGSFDYATNTGPEVVNVRAIARWNGNVWSPLGSGIGGFSPYVGTLVVSDADLYAGGDFVIAGGKVSAFAARADISMFIPLQIGVTRYGDQLNLFWPARFSTAILGNYSGGF